MSTFTQPVGIAPNVQDNSTDQSGDQDISIYSAVFFLMQLINAVNDLQRPMSAVASQCADLVSMYSTKESDVLQQDTANYDKTMPGDPDDTNARLAKHNQQFQEHQLMFNNFKTMPQSEAESYQTSVSSLSRSTMNLYQMTSEIQGLFKNLSNLLKS